MAINPAELLSQTNISRNPDTLPGPSGPQADPLFNQPAVPGDLFPNSEEEQERLLAWCNSAFIAAEDARRSYEDKWRRYYKLYRSYMKRRPGDWRSQVFVPIAFWIIETIVPRLVAQLPKFTCNPVGPEDVRTAQMMEKLLDWSVKESELYVELVKAFKSSLRYGTGILKTYHRQDVRRARRMQPMQVPVTQRIEVPIPGVFDMDGRPMTEIREETAIVDLGQQAQRYSYVAYDGPAAECIDIFNFWVAPEADDVDSARYVIHRTYKEMSYIMRRVQEGIYRLPDNMGPDDITNIDDEPHLARLNSIGLGAAVNTDPTRKPVELLEFWTDDGRVITMANRKAILRVQENPFDHSEKPFIRIVDYLAEHEFWGIGEIEPLEGLQDLQNALVNSRVDNVRLVLNSMFAVNIQNVEDLRDLQMRPGGIIRLKGDFRPNEVIERVNLGDVTGSAFQESEIVGNFIEKVSGVSAYQMGLDSPSLNNTATGVAIIQEQGASRFGLKNKLAELMGLRRLGRHYGSILQQFTTEERSIRLNGPEGQILFQTFDPESLQGALDYDIQAESTTQTDTMRQEQKMNLLQLVAQFAPQGTMAALEDVLETMGVKDKQRYLMGAPPTMPGPQQPGLAQGAAPPPALPPGAAPSPQDPYGAFNPAAGTFGQANAERMIQQIAQSYGPQG